MAGRRSQPRELPMGLSFDRDLCARYAESTRNTRKHCVWGWLPPRLQKRYTPGARFVQSVSPHGNSEEKLPNFGEGTFLSWLVSSKLAFVLKRRISTRMFSDSNSCGSVKRGLINRMNPSVDYQFQVRRFKGIQSLFELSFILRERSKMRKNVG